MYICIIQYNDNSEITSLMKHLKKNYVNWVLSQCQLGSLFWGNARGSESQYHHLKEHQPVVIN